MITFQNLEWRVVGKTIVADAFGISTFYKIMGRAEFWTLVVPGKNCLVYEEGHPSPTSAKSAARADFNHRIRMSLKSVEG